MQLNPTVPCQLLELSFYFQDGWSTTCSHILRSIHGFPSALIQISKLQTTVKTSAFKSRKPMLVFFAKASDRKDAVNYQFSKKERQADYF
eukprot:m.93602 g.93602  ORF g.93602 m.93602 type:complete len:90 (+) comp36786_c0_seq36:1429-1698(+)